MKSKLILVAIATVITCGAFRYASAGPVSIKGSNTFGEEFGPLVISAFREKHPGIDVILESKGTGTGIQALLNGECDIASASRAMNEDEVRLAKSRGIRVQHNGVAYYSVAVIVNAENPVSGLADHEVRDLFTGKITSWRDVGGRNAPVALVIRDPSSGTHLGFQELAMANQPYADAALAKASYLAIVEEVAANPNAIGYCDTRTANIRGVKAIAVNQFKPTGVAIAEGLYPYVRMLRFYTRRDGTTPEARKFIQFVQSRDGQTVAENFGYNRLRQTLQLSPMPDQ